MGLLYASDLASLKEAALRLGGQRAFGLFVAVFCGYLFRWVKYHWFLRKLRVRLRKIDSLGIYLAGLSMAISPGKLGEVLKSFLIRRQIGVPVSRTAPAVLMDRVTDVLALLVILIFYSRFGRAPGWLEGVGLVGIFFLLFFLSQPALVLDWLEKFPDERKKGSILFVVRFLKAAKELSSLTVLVGGTILSLFAWVIEGMVLVRLGELFGYSLVPPLGLWIFAFATLAGALSMLPGGLGAQEGSLTFLLHQHGIPPDIGVAISFLLRAFTLWFGVALGLFFLILVEGVSMQEVVEIEDADPISSPGRRRR